MLNLFTEFKRLLPNVPLQVGTVVGNDNGVFSIELPGGGILKARGNSYVGQKVFVRDGVIEGTAPALPLELIEV
jgi:hypothetical protein